MFETLLAGLGILFVYKLAHDFMLNHMIEDAKKPVLPERIKAKG